MGTARTERYRSAKQEKAKLENRGKKSWRDGEKRGDFNTEVTEGRRHGEEGEKRKAGGAR